MGLTRSVTTAQVRESGIRSSRSSLLSAVHVDSCWYIGCSTTAGADSVRIFGLFLTPPSSAATADGKLQMQTAPGSRTMFDLLQLIPRGERAVPVATLVGFKLTSIQRGQAVIELEAG